MTMAVTLSSAAVCTFAAEPNDIFGVSYTLDNMEYTVNSTTRNGLDNTEWYLEKPDYLVKTDESNVLALVLPYDAASVQLYAQIDDGKDVYLDGVKLQDNQAVVLADGTIHSIQADGKSYILDVSYGSKIPAMYINTQSGNLDYVYASKKNKEAAYMTLVDDGKTLYSGELDYLKGRGNFTWDSVTKKSFSIKFMEEIDLFGMGASKGYALLANHVDFTMIRNTILFNFADTVGLKYSPQTQYLELYINNKYMGLYALTEKIEVGEGHVEINDLEQQTIDANPYEPVNDGKLMGQRHDEDAFVPGSYKWIDIKNNPADITGGYILQLEIQERYVEELSGFVTSYGQTVLLASPGYASKEQVEYIKDYYQQFEDAALSEDGYNSLGKHYSEYIDVQSVARMLLLHEFAKNLDATNTSFYFCKDINGKLVAAPVWDMDSGFGRYFERYEIDFNDTKDLWVAGGRMIGSRVEHKHTILAFLWNHQDFREVVFEEWHTNFAPKTESLVAEAQSLTDYLEKSIDNDRQMWLGGNLTDESLERWCSESYDFMIDFIRKRSAYLSETYKEENLRVLYEGNGGSEAVLDGNLYPEGAYAKVMENGFRYDGADFIGWNTKPDGSGEAYSPGDRVEVTDGLTLYAQWSMHPVTEQPAEGGIIGIIKSIIRRILG